MTPAASLERPSNKATVDTAIDCGRPFIPAMFCPFTYVTEAAGLPEAIHLRQNQLHGLCALEVIQLFERAGCRALAPLAREMNGTALGDTLDEFIADETRHSAQFAALNRAAAPMLYENSDHCFVRGPRWTGPLSRLFCSGPRRFPFWPWLMILQEEKSLFLSRAYLRDTSGLEPNFLEIYRAHAADEAHHVAWDEALINEVWPQANRLRRAFNARLLAWMVREFFHSPKRAGVRMLDQLAREFPDHAASLRKLRQPLVALGKDPSWHRVTYGEAMVPRTLALMKPWPELAPLARFVAHGFST